MGSAAEPQGENEATPANPLVARHVAFGWWMLLLFLSLGIVLEGLHAFKVGWYLDVGNESRRLVWRLAHAHGTLLAAINILFGCTVSLCAPLRSRPLSTASLSLMAATILLPGGFFLGGLFLYDGDPGLGVWLVPLGAVLLLLAVFLIARRSRP